MTEKELTQVVSKLFDKHSDICQRQKFASDSEWALLDKELELLELEIEVKSKELEILHYGQSMD
jgi:hypothetical protein